MLGVHLVPAHQHTAMKAKTKKKVLSRQEKIDLAIEAMDRAMSQFEQTGFALTTGDVGPISVAYGDEDDTLYISARNMEDGWALSFGDISKQLIERVTTNGDDYDDIADHSTSLVSSLRKVANQIECGVRKFLCDNGLS